MRAAIYVRVSRDPMGTALGIARQEKDCRALADARGWEVVAIFRENDTSAFSGKRPAWRDLLQALSDGDFDVVIAWANDRLYRRARDQLDLMERAKKIVTIQDGEIDSTTAEGQLRAGILANIAQFESGRKSERLRAKHRELAEAGVWPGGAVPFGYRRDGSSLKVHPKEAEALREAAAMILDGATLRSAADELGMYTRTVKRLLMSPHIAGRRIYNGDELKASWPPILDVRTWRRVRSLLDDPARGPKGPRPKYLLTGLVRCGTCGGLLSGRPQTGIRGYACLNSTCPKPKVQTRAQPLEDLILRLASERPRSRTTIADPASRREIYERLDEIDQELVSWARKAAQAGLSVQEIAAGRQPLAAEREKLERQLAEQVLVTGTDSDGRHYVDMDATIALRNKRNPRRAVSTRTDLEQRIERITVHPVGRNPHVPLEDRVEVTWGEVVYRGEGEPFALLT